MGKKEQLDELDHQLARAKSKVTDAHFNLGFAIASTIIGFLFPILWLLAIMFFCFAIYYYVVYGKRINEVNYEKAKLK